MPPYIWLYVYLEYCKPVLSKNVVTKVEKKLKVIYWVVVVII